MLRLLVALLALAPALHAQGLVQLALAGQVERTGGQRVEVEITVASVSTKLEPRTIALALHLAELTTAADLAALLAKRLAQSGVSALDTSAGRPARGVSCLFVEDVVAIALRLGEGLRASVTLCEDRPLSVRLAPPEQSRHDAVLRVAATTWHPHLKTHQRVELERRFDSGTSAASVADALSTQAIQKGWGSEVEGHETWRPAEQANGAQVQGVSFELMTSGDWRLEIALPPRREQR